MCGSGSPIGPLVTLDLRTHRLGQLVTELLCQGPLVVGVWLALVNLPLLKGNVVAFADPSQHLSFRRPQQSLTICAVRVPKRTLAVPDQVDGVVLLVKEGKSPCPGQLADGFLQTNKVDGIIDGFRVRPKLVV